MRHEAQLNFDHFVQEEIENLFEKLHQFKYMLSEFPRGSNDQLGFVN